MLVPLEKKEKLSHASLEKDCEPGFGLKAHYLILTGFSQQGTPSKSKPHRLGIYTYNINSRCSYKLKSHSKI